MDKNNPQGEIKYIIRVANTDLEGKKAVLYAMRKIKGIGLMYANAVLAIAKVDPAKKAGLLANEEVELLNSVLQDPKKFNIPTWMMNRRKDYETGEDGHLLSADLRFTKDNDIKRLKKIKTNRGMRHAWGLPLRGQRTKSNFRRNKGKTTLGVSKKKDVKK
ncbi:MAG: 30S ribosomal protein S13 [archaeon]